MDYKNHNFRVRRVGAKSLHALIDVISIVFIVLAFAAMYWIANRVVIIEFSELSSCIGSQCSNLMYNDVTK